MATLASGSTLYLSAAEFLRYFDTRMVAELLSDTGTKVQNPAGEASLQELLRAACGEVEACALRGGRYTADTLAAIATSGTFAAGHLKKLVAVCAMNNLRSRRGRVGEEELQSHKWAEQHLKALRQGEEIFGVVEEQEAAHLHADHDDQTRRTRRSGISVHASPFWGLRGGDRR